jgi:hypothetical protein
MPGNSLPYLHRDNGKIHAASGDCSPIQDLAHTLITIVEICLRDHVDLLYYAGDVPL